MATAAKYGAQDLNGSLYIYQQLVAPVSSNNVIVNVNFTNRNYADARVRLALTDRPLVPQTVSTSSALAPIALSSTSASGNVLTAHGLTISNTTTSSNLITTASIAVTATTVSTNLITCANTATLIPGTPVVFSGALGGLATGTVYYVLTVPSGTQFTVSRTWGGAVHALTTASGSINVQQATTNLQVNQPVVFSGTTFGGIVAGTTYFVRTIDSNTTFTISATTGPGAVFALTTASGTMSCAESTSALSLNQPIMFTGPTLEIISISGTSITLNGSTSWLTVNQAIEFFGQTFGGVIEPSVVYYVQSIGVNNTFTISSTQGGPALNVGTYVGPMYATVGIGTNLSVTTTYFVKTIPSSTTFTVSATAGGDVITLGNSSGIMLTNGNMLTLGTGSTSNLQTGQVVTFSGTSFGNLIPLTSLNGIPAPYIITNTSTTPSLTTTNTTGLIAGQPVVFYGNTLSNIVAGRTYYIRSILSGTTFDVSETVGGTAVALTNASGSFQMVPAYYVKHILSTTHFTVSATNNGPIWATTAGSGTLTATAQPVDCDYIEYDSLIAGTGVLERTGVIVPPGKYLYASSNISRVSALAVGIQESVV